MKKILIIIVIVGFGTIAPVQKLEAQIDIAAIIKAAVKKVIKAVDLQIQRFPKQYFASVLPIHHSRIQAG